MAIVRPVGGGSSYTDEQAQDAAAALFTSGSHTGITANYVDASNRVDLAATGGGASNTVTANTQTASYTLVLSDADNKAVDMNSASATTVTVPPNSSVAFPVGAMLEVARLGAGTVTLTQGSGVTIRVPTGTPLTLRAQYSTAGLRKIATNEWLASGDLG